RPGEPASAAAGREPCRPQRSAPRTRRPGREAGAAAGRAALHAQLVPPASLPELARVGSGLGQRGKDGRHGDHRESSSAPYGSLDAAATKTSSVPGTWQVEVPRTCRTASVRLLKPWMKASESWPPWVFTGRRPSGPRTAPPSPNGPPSPGAQDPPSARALSTIGVEAA